MVRSAVWSRETLLSYLLLLSKAILIHSSSQVVHMKWAVLAAGAALCSATKLITTSE